MQLSSPVPSSPIQTYRYSPLKHEQDIRLLYLLPGHARAPLSCTLRIVSLSELPDYEAVSYTWGEPIFSALIECFSKGQLPITENLSKALFHLRLANRLRVLWIDAICINQQDLDERSHQVTLLRDTFQRAKKVIVWLGEDTGEAKKAFKSLRAIDPSPSLYALVILSGIRIRRRCQKQREENELEIRLYNYRSCLASDPRDKVFALVGLARGHIALACIPDYTKSMLEVYTEIENVSLDFR